MYKRSIARLAVVTKLPEAKHQPAPWNNRRSAADIHALRQKYQAPMHKHFYKEPLMLVTGKMQYVWDSEGKRYLDMYGGVCTISAGHSHPKCVEATIEQVQRHQHSTPLYNEPTNYEFMERIAKHLPKGKDWVFHFTSSGSEANDFASYVARTYTGKNTFVSLTNGYHGLTDAPRSFVTTPGWRNHVPPSMHVIRAPAPTPYRGIFGSDLDKYVQVLEESIDAEGGAVAGFIAERIQGVGGLQPLLDGYLPRAYEIVRKRGGLVISDEVQCGFGRLGKTFWGFELDGVVPDMITCAKSLSNGMPLGACILTREVAESIKHAFFNTFGGNPVSTAWANAALKAVEEEGMQAHCGKIGEQLVGGLKKLQDKFEIIGDVRGMGIMVGVEFVKDRVKKTPFTVPEFNEIQEGLRERGILVGRGGRGNTMRLQGPYPITAEDVDYFLFSLEEVLKTIKK